MVLVIYYFGFKEGLCKVCDDFVVEEICSSKVVVLKFNDLIIWFV